MSWIDELINEAGVELTLTRVTGGDMDGVTGKRTGEVSTDYKPYGVPTKDRSATVKAINGTPLNDRVFLMDTTVEPEVGDRVTVDGDTFTIKESVPTYENGVAVFYTVGMVR